MSTLRQTITAPCKVNLTLDVTAPREDGFHDIDSIAAKFSPADEITFFTQEVPRTMIQLTCDDPAIPGGAGNLAYRAARLFAQNHPAATFAVVMELRKRLPIEAGLGGGSSDAGAILLALQKQYPLPEETLRKIAAELGSDVPQFLHPGAVRMRGRGEQIEALPRAMPTLHGVLVKPRVGVPTPSAYKLLDALPDRVPGAATENLLAVLRGGSDLAALGAAFGNDFEAAILPAHPEIADAHHAVERAGAIRALLCGSGSAVFGLASDARHAAAMAATLRAGKWFPWVQAAESLP